MEDLTIIRDPYFLVLYESVFIQELWKSLFDAALVTKFNLYSYKNIENYQRFFLVSLDVMIGVDF